MSTKRKNLKRKQSSLAKETLSKKSREELLLEEALFGSTAAATSTVPQFTHAEDNTDSDASVADESDIENEEIDFVIDTAPTAVKDSLLKSKAVAPASGAVWVDEDDDQLMVDLNSSNRLKKLKTGEMTSSFVSGTQYSELLQNRYDAKKNSVWEVHTGDSDNEDEDALDAEDYMLLTEAGGLLKSTGGHRDKYLPIAPESISVKRLLDANVTEYCSKPVSCLQFHPYHANLLLVASEDKHLRIFDLDDKKNEKVVGVHFKDLPILNAKFIGPTAEEIIVSGRKPYFYVYAMQTGQVSQYQVPHHKRHLLKSLEKMAVSPNGCLVLFVGHEGSLHLLDTRSKQWVWEGTMNCSARTAHFVDNRSFVSSGFDAEVYDWEIQGGDFDSSVNTRTSHAQRPALQVSCRRRTMNEDGTSSLSLATYTPPSSSSTANATTNTNGDANPSNVALPLIQTPQFYVTPDVDYLCVGAMSGVASIFHRRSSNHHVDGGEFSLMKSVMNLTTKLTSVAFHPSGQLLVIASNEKKDQLKLVHLPSGSVYMNWPRLVTLNKHQAASSNDTGRKASPFHRIMCLEFSPDGRLLALGNGRGRVLLYQLNHFTDYHERRFREIKQRKQDYQQQQLQQQAVEAEEKNSNNNHNNNSSNSKNSRSGARNRSGGNNRKK